MTAIEQLSEWAEREVLTPAEREKLALAEPYLDKIAKAFQPPFMDEFMSAAGDAQKAMEYTAFSTGFRLGVQLVVEGLQP